MNILKVGVALILLITLYGFERRAPSTDCGIDEARSRPALVTYREELVRALTSRRVEDLRRLVRDDVGVGFGGSGWTELVDVHRLTDPRADAWSDWKTLLERGGRFGGHLEFCAPWYTCPPLQESGPARVAVVSQNVWALAGPDASTKRLRSVSCQVLPVEASRASRPALPPGWEAVWLPDNIWGFVPRSAVAAPGRYLLVDWREGVWKLSGVHALD